MVLSTQTTSTKGKFQNLAGFMRRFLHPLHLLPMPHLLHPLLMLQLFNLLPMPHLLHLLLMPHLSYSLLMLLYRHGRRCSTSCRRCSTSCRRRSTSFRRHCLSCSLPSIFLYHGLFLSSFWHHVQKASRQGVLMLHAPVDEPNAFPSFGTRDRTTSINMVITCFLDSCWV
jgi:hypothetical protein